MRTFYFLINYIKKYQLIIDKDVVGTHDNQPYTNYQSLFRNIKNTV